MATKRFNDEAMKIIGAENQSLVWALLKLLPDDKMEDADLLRSILSKLNSDYTKERPEAGAVNALVLEGVNLFGLNAFGAKILLHVGAADAKGLQSIVNLITGKGSSEKPANPRIEERQQAVTQAGIKAEARPTFTPQDQKPQQPPKPSPKLTDKKDPSAESKRRRAAQQEKATPTSEVDKGQPTFVGRVIAKVTSPFLYLIVLVSVAAERVAKVKFSPVDFLIYCFAVVVEKIGAMIPTSVKEAVEYFDVWDMLYGILVSVVNFLTGILFRWSFRRLVYLPNFRQMSGWEKTVMVGSVMLSVVIISFPIYIAFGVLGGGEADEHKTALNTDAIPAEEPAPEDVSTEAVQPDVEENAYLYGLESTPTWEVLIVPDMGNVGPYMYYTLDFAGYPFAAMQNEFSLFCTSGQEGYSFPVWVQLKYSGEKQHWDTIVDLSDDYIDRSCQ